VTPHIQRVVQVKAEGPSSLLVTFSDGRVQRVELAPMLRGELFGPLADPAEFARVEIDGESGCVVWPCGADLDPGVLYNWPVAAPRLFELAERW
jgi:hypothetical protein